MSSSLAGRRQTRRLHLIACPGRLLLSSSRPSPRLTSLSSILTPSATPLPLSSPIIHSTPKRSNSPPHDPIPTVFRSLHSIFTHRWAAENGYWVGDLSFFSGDLAPNYDPAYLNYPFDHYKGFITGSVEGGSYSQREPRVPTPAQRPPHPHPTPHIYEGGELYIQHAAHLRSASHAVAGNTFLYKPQTATRCAENNATYVDDETCGTMGTANLFQADQTTEYCNQKEGGRISGPDSKNWNGTYPTITTLIGTQAVLYQVLHIPIPARCYTYTSAVLYLLL